MRTSLLSIVVALFLTQVAHADLVFLTIETDAIGDTGIIHHGELNHLGELDKLNFAPWDECVTSGKMPDSLTFLDLGNSYNSDIVTIYVAPEDVPADGTPIKDITFIDTCFAGGNYYRYSATAVPEPSSLAVLSLLTAVMLIGFAIKKRRMSRI